MNKRKVIFIAVAVLSLVEIILVLLVDCTVIAWLSQNDDDTEFIANVGTDGPLKRAILLMYCISSEMAVLGWSIGHMVIHIEWLVSSCILLIFAFKPDPRRSYQVLQFALSVIIVCICDAGAGIHTSVIIAKGDVAVEATSARVFFPLFFTKGGLFWLVNLSASILMLIILMRIHKARRAAESRQHLAKSAAIGERQDKVGSYWREDIIQQPAVLPRVRNVTDHPQKIAIEEPPSTAAYNQEYVPTRVTSDVGSIEDPYEDYTQWGSGPSSSASHSRSQQAYH